MQYSCWNFMTVKSFKFFVNSLISKFYSIINSGFCCAKAKFVNKRNIINIIDFVIISLDFDWFCAMLLNIILRWCELVARTLQFLLFLCENFIKNQFQFYYLQHLQNSQNRDLRDYETCIFCSFMFFSKIKTICL